MKPYGSSIPVCIQDTVCKMSALAKCCFRFEREWPRDYLSLLEAIGASIRLSEVRHFDTSRSGLVVLTLSSEAECQKLITCGFSWNNVKVSVLPFVPNAVTVRLTGCWFELKDSAIWRALAQYGKVVSEPSHATIAIGDFNVETDTRVVICVLSKPLPTSLEIGRGKLRVHHRGQVQSCFLCGEEGHFARECEKRQKRDDQKSEKTPDTRNGSGQRRPSTSAVPQPTNPTTATASHGQSKLPRPTTSATTSTARANASRSKAVGPISKVQKQASKSAREHTDGAACLSAGAPTTPFYASRGKSERTSPVDYGDSAGYETPGPKKTARKTLHRTTDDLHSPALSQRFSSLEDPGENSRPYSGLTDDVQYSKAVADEVRQIRNDGVTTNTHHE